MSEKIESAYSSILFGHEKPTLLICDGNTPQGQFILANRDGETDFDGFHHAYVERDGQTFLVPLWEWKDE